MSLKDVKLPTSAELKTLKEEILEELEAAQKACMSANRFLNFENGFLYGVQSATLEAVAKFAEPVLDPNYHDGLVKATARTVNHIEQVHMAAHELIGDSIECPGLTLLHEELDHAVQARKARQLERVDQIIQRIMNKYLTPDPPTDPQKIN